MHLVCTLLRLESATATAIFVFGAPRDYIINRSARQNESSQEIPHTAHSSGVVEPGLLELLARHFIKEVPFLPVGQPLQTPPHTPTAEGRAFAKK